ncbi:MAG: glycosyltransferase family 4 protein [Candidatus Omnitrophica bacterium]|nr:glycosyltransferase family 4 protein [Candidatus Omnitrophota bacterium]MDD5137789.1 glycosyltransferase family 4 protein [Candidatus Omnitrophota bacterium]MDD5538217.1 glycosyltransferase family 4 protein [Candidatus Omnitrophota bacterium]
MNILILTNHLNYGGVSVYVHQLAALLVRKYGAKVFIGSRGGDLEAELKRDGIAHIRLPLTTKCEVSPKVLVSALKLKGLVRREKIDVIHANTRVTQVLGSLVSLLTRRPMVTTCHGYFKRRLGRVFMPCWGRRVIAISDQVRDHLAYDFDVPTDRIDLVYNGIDPQRFVAHAAAELASQKQAWGIDAGKLVVGHIGRLSSVKGQKYMLLAADILRARRPELRWVIVGDGNEGKHLRQLIAEKKLQDIVRLCPSAGNTSLALAAMDVFVMPSLQEGLGISILEAQAQGVPVVASRVGGIPTVIEDGVTGLLVSPGDPPAIAAAVERLLEDRSLAQATVSRAKKRVTEAFSLDSMTQKTQAVYQSVL